MALGTVIVYSGPVFLYILGFPTGRDSTAFLEKGTEVSSLLRDKGTTGQAQNLAMGRDGPGEPIKIWDGTWTIFLSKSRTGQGRNGIITISVL